MSRKYKIVRFLLCSFFVPIQIIQSQDGTDLNKLLFELKTNKTDSFQLKTLWKVSAEFVKLGEWDSVGYYADQLYSLARQKMASRYLLAAYFYQADFFHHGSKFQLALDKLSAALKISLETKDTLAIIKSYMSYGNTYHELDKVPEAIKAHNESLRFSRLINSKPHVSLSLLNLANMYSRGNDFDKAISAYNSALNWFEEQKDSARCALVMHNMGKLYADKHDYIVAMKWYARCRAISKAIRDDFMLGKTCYKIGDLYYQVGDFQNSYYHFKEGLAIFNRLEEVRDVSDCYYGLGKVLMKQGKSNSAREMFDRALGFYKENNLKSDLEDMYEVYAQVDSAEGKYKSAYENYKRFILYRDSVREEENAVKASQEIMRMDFEKIEDSLRYEQKNITDKLDKEILRSKARRAEKNFLLAGAAGLLLLCLFIFRILHGERKAKKLMHIAAEKEKAELQLQSLRAQLNPHFMFNSLSALQELILRQETDKSQSYLEKFAQLLRVMLENADQPLVSVRKELDFVELYLSLEQLRIPNLQFSIQLDPTIDPDQVSVPNMMLQPYIENSLWHGLQYKRGEKKLQILINSAPDGLRFLVRDNGVGRKKAEEFKSQFRKAHRSRGMELLSKRFSLLSKEYGKEIKSSIEDIQENQQTLCTLVTIEVPANLDNKISLS